MDKPTSRYSLSVLFGLPFNPQESVSSLPYCKGDAAFAVVFSRKAEEIQALAADPSQTVLWLDRVLLCPVWSFSTRWFFNSS